MVNLKAYDGQVFHSKGCPPICCHNCLPFLGQLSPKFWSASVGIYAPSVKTVLVRSDTDVGKESLVGSRHFSSLQMCSVGLKPGLCAGQWSSSIPTLSKHVFIGLALHIIPFYEGPNEQFLYVYCFWRHWNCVVNDSTEDRFWSTTLWLKCLLLLDTSICIIVLTVDQDRSSNGDLWQKWHPM